MICIDGQRCGIWSRALGEVIHIVDLTAKAAQGEVVHDDDGACGLSFLACALLDDTHPVEALDAVLHAELVVEVGVAIPEVDGEADGKACKGVECKAQLAVMALGQRDAPAEHHGYEEEQQQAVGDIIEWERLAENEHRQGCGPCIGKCRLTLKAPRPQSHEQYCCKTVGTKQRIAHSSGDNHIGQAETLRQHAEQPQQGQNGRGADDGCVEIAAKLEHIVPVAKVHISHNHKDCGYEHQGIVLILNAECALGEPHEQRHPEAVDKGS